MIIKNVEAYNIFGQLKLIRKVMKKYGLTVADLQLKVAKSGKKLIRTPFFPYIIANQINNIYHTTPLQN